MDKWFKFMLAWSLLPLFILEYIAFCFFDILTGEELSLGIYNNWKEFAFLED